MGVYHLLLAIILPSLMTFIAMSKSATNEVIAVLGLIIITVVLVSKIDNEPKKLYVKMPVLVSGLIIGGIASGAVLLVQSFF